MTKLGMFNWCVLIGIITGVYSGLYLLIPFLADAGVIYATFIALPIFFLSGGNRKDYPNFAVGNVTGVVWGLIYIFLINTMIGAGVNDVLSIAVVCLVITIVCCSFHMIVTANTVFNKLPAMFGGIAAAFSTWGENWIQLMITLVLGTTICLLMVEGAKLLNPEGQWKFLAKK